MAETATAEPEATDDLTGNGPETDSLGLERIPSGSILQAARYNFDPKQIEAIRRTVAKDCTDAELVMFLEVAARYELDPFAKQIFAAKMKGGVQIIVSRDGLLAHAHRQEDFGGLVGDVVRANDDFGVTYEDGERRLRHAYKTGISKEGGENVRGPIIGAWAEVTRWRGDYPHRTFFYADLGEYRRSGDTPWAKQTSAMILKVAEAMALRKAYTVSGVVGEEEVNRPGGRETESLTSLPEVDFGDDDLAQRLTDLVDEANTVQPGAYRPAKLKGLLEGPPEGWDERREGLANELADFIAEHGEAIDAEIVAADESDQPAE